METGGIKQATARAADFLHRHSLIIRAAALAVFSIVLLVLTLNHEYWFDEAQAWNIARDNDIKGIIEMMKYEGHPPLWHLVLKLFISLGCSYPALGLISWGVTVITAALILFALPIHPLLKAAFILSGGMIHVNSVLSRVYCLIYLIVTLIAVIYPQRKKHPLLFGLLLALLANTHVCMCGLVGILGIFMIIDFFAEFKSGTKKQNILTALGLAVGGLGVIALILPLLGCFQANSFAASKVYTPEGVISSFLHSYSDIISSACSSGLPVIMQFVLSTAAQLIMAAAVLLLWKKRRTFVIELVFVLYYLVVVGVIWYSISNRGALFLYTAAMILVMGREEKPVTKKALPLDGKSGGRIEKKLKEFIVRLRDNAFYEKAMCVLMSALLFASTPTGTAMARFDMREDYSFSKSAALFIRDNMGDEAMLASKYDDYPELMIYLPEYKIYSFVCGRFYSYYSHTEDKTEDAAKAFREVSEGVKEVWFVSNMDMWSAGYELLYTDEGNVWIYRIGVEEFIEFVGAYRGVN